MNDQPHIFNSTFVYELPFGKDHKLGGGSSFGRAVLSGWELSGITQYSSGGGAMFVFIQRINIGLYGIFARLRATANWRRSGCLPN